MSLAFTVVAPVTANANEGAGGGGELDPPEGGGAPFCSPCSLVNLSRALLNIVNLSANWFTLVPTEAMPDVTVEPTEAAPAVTLVPTEVTPAVILLTSPVAAVVIFSPIPPPIWEPSPGAGAGAGGALGASGSFVSSFW